MYFSKSELDTGIYEAIRKVLVERGHLPDRATYNTEGTFQTQRQVLIGQGKLQIDLIGVDTILKQGETNNNKIFIQRSRITKGNLGTAGVKEYTELEDGNFDIADMPNFTSHVYYEIRYVTQKMKDEQIISDVLNLAVGGSGFQRFLKGINPENLEPTEDEFRLAFQDEQSLNLKPYREVIATYRVEDVYVVSSEFIEQTAPMEFTDTADLIINPEPIYNNEIPEFEEEGKHDILIEIKEIAENSGQDEAIFIGIEN